MGQDINVIRVPDAGAKPPRKPPVAPLPVLLDDAALAEVVHRQLAACRRNRTQLALLILQREPGIAPALVEAMGERLRGRVRAIDFIYQMDAGGFAVVLLGAGRVNVPTVQRRIERALSGPYVIDGLGGLAKALHHLSVRIGMAAHPQADVTGAEMVRAAMPSAN